MKKTKLCFEILKQNELVDFMFCLCGFILSMFYLFRVRYLNVSIQGIKKFIALAEFTCIIKLLYYHSISGIKRFMKMM